MAPTWGQRLRGIVGSVLGADIIEENLERAVRDAQVTAEKAASPQSFFHDPYSMFFGREWLVRGNVALTPMDLRMMARSPIVGSIIQTRLNQISAFCQPSTNSYDYGFKVVPVHPEEKDKKDLKKNQDLLTEFLRTAGTLNYGEGSLEQFCRKVMRDSLTLDIMAAEIVPRKDGLPAYFVGVDAGTIVKLPESLKYDNSNPKEFVYAQLLDEVIRVRYTREQMMFGVRNPQTDIRANGYGMSELEMLINIVTIMGNAEKYNSTLLSQGGTQKGVMVVKGEVDKKEVDSFRRDFREAVQNAAQYWKAPVLSVGKEVEVNWLTIDRANKDMEYAQLFEFIVKVATAVYQIAPEEVNWKVGISGQRVAFNSGAKDTLDYSKDKGLRPLVSFFGDQLTMNLITKFDPRLKVAFEGIGAAAVDNTEMRVKEVTNFKTINQIREEMGMEPIVGGDIILNPTYIQALAGAGAAAAPAGGNGADTQVDDWMSDPDMQTLLDSPGLQKAMQKKGIVSIDWAK